MTFMKCVEYLMMMSMRRLQILTRWMMKMAEYTFTFQIGFGWGDVFETAVNTELPCGRPRSSSHLRKACVGGEYAPEYAIEAAGWACSCTL
jgi:hypothetical protein